MSSLLLQPVLLESCHSSLRERRRSSVHTLSAVPRLFASTPLSEGSAVFDEKDDPHENASQAFIPPLSTLTHAHLPDHASELTIPADYRSQPTIYTCDVSTPFSETPPTTVQSRLSTLSEESIPESEKLERLKWRLASGFFAYFMCGWGDGVTGTVLPFFMAEFHISFMTCSLLYAGSTIGFVAGTLLVEAIDKQLGRFDLKKASWSWTPKISLPVRIFPASRKAAVGYSPSQARLVGLLASSILHGMFFVIMGSGRSFWVLFFAYALAAFARAILTASLNAYYASGPQQSIGFAYGLWSLGGVASPLVCQALIAAGVPWHRFYLGSLVLSATNTTFLILTYRPTQTEFRRDREAALLLAQQNINEGSSSNETSSQSSEKFNECESSAENITADTKDTPNASALRLAIRLPYQWFVCLFGLLYCGCETATQSLMVSYLLGARNANPKTVGYVTSGFWGGITVGRFIWGHYTPGLSYTQRKFYILGFIVEDNLIMTIHLAIGLSMQILIWLVNSEIENAFSTAVIGFFYGPIFPGCLALANDILPSEIRMVSMALISATSSIGAALFPFIAGTISSVQGIHTVMYITVPLALSILVLWIFFPSKQPQKQKD